MSDYEAMHAMYLKLVRMQANAIDELQKIVSNLTLAMQEAEEIWINADSPTEDELTAERRIRLLRINQPPKDRSGEQK